MSLADELHLNDASATLTLLTDYLERFVSEWDAEGVPPPIEQFLPKAGPLRKMVLVELIKVDLEYRWQDQLLPKRVIDYIDQFPELVTDGIPVELLYEEFHIRQQNGDRVDAKEYLEQFPAQADAIGKMLNVGLPYESTALFGSANRISLDDIEPGQQIDDFDLLTRLGRGAFAAVFLARQRSMQRLVAVKISADTGTEPQTLGQLDHDAIVRVYDQRCLPEQKMRLLYMQYIPGGTLQMVVSAVTKRETPPPNGTLVLDVVNRLLEARGEARSTSRAIEEQFAAMTWPETVCWLGWHLAEGLHAAHEKKVLHCDVKPANVLLTVDGFPKLADFNVSCNANLAGVAPAAFFGGSLAYMSPEQLEACNPNHARHPETLDGRTDVYSLGIVLWELLTGQRPYADEPVKGNWSATLEQMTQRREQGIADEQLENVPADCPPGVLAVLQQCLTANLSERFPSAAIAAQRLQLCMNPAAEKRIYPKPKSLYEGLRYWAPVIAVLLAGIPNILAGVFNFAYNHHHIIVPLQNAYDRFFRIQFAINAIAYPLGMGLIAWLTYSVSRPINTASLSPEKLAALRHRALMLGHWVAVICVIEWIVAGIAYPLSLHAAMGNVPPEVYPHFLGSLVLCGLIAAAYPFYGITTFAVRVLYPRLLPSDFRQADDGAEHKQLETLAWRYLAIALSVPLLSVAALVAFQLDERWIMILLSLGGVFGFGLVFWLFRLLQDDLAALASVLTPRK